MIPRHVIHEPLIVNFPDRSEMETDSMPIAKETDSFVTQMDKR